MLQLFCTSETVCNVLALIWADPLRSELCSHWCLWPWPLSPISTLFIDLPLKPREKSTAIYRPLSCLSTTITTDLHLPPGYKLSRNANDWLSGNLWSDAPSFPWPSLCLFSGNRQLLTHRFFRCFFFFNLVLFHLWMSAPPFFFHHCHPPQTLKNCNFLPSVLTLP